MTRVLLVEPDEARRTRLCQALAAHREVNVVEASDAPAAATVDLRGIDVAVSNADLGQGRGIDLHSTLGAIPLILYAENGSVRCAVEAMQQGAVDYLVVPFEPAELFGAIERCLKCLTGHSGRTAPIPIIGHSTAMLDLLEQIDVVARRECSVLIEGEAGSGKELVARAVHVTGPRRQMPLISLNCAAIPAPSIEAELFGVDTPAGSENSRIGLIEAAHHGILFLDEIAELPLHAQARLSEALRDGRYLRIGATHSRPADILVIAATHLALEPLVAAGAFRADLYQMLHATTLSVPPLRERGDDIVELTNWLLQRICHKLSKPELGLSKAAMAAIRAYAWPGNVRELENALERAVILCEGSVIEPSLLAIDPVRPIGAAKIEARDVATSLEGYFVKFVLDHQDSLTETELANKLGISRKSLWERRQRLNIPRKRTRTRGARRDVDFPS
jgi:DNA-binding NtrC family response regulator